MLFDSPIPFADALDSRKVKALLPTELSSGELAELGPEILQHAMFSARTSNAEYLQTIADLIDNILNPHTEMRDGKPFTAGIDIPAARLAAKQKLAELDYVPAPEDEGTIKDLSSDKRINLALSMGVQQAQGYGQWKQSQDEDALDAFPGRELFRLEARKEPRAWHSIWQGAGGRLHDGRMIALVNDPIWLRLSDFGTPSDPLKWGTGMWSRPVAREECTAFGLITDAQRVTPQTRGFNNDLQLTPALRSQALIGALVNLGYKFTEGVLSLAE